MENRQELIAKLKQATETMRQLQADMLVMKEYITRYIENRKEAKEQQMNFSFEGEDDQYSIKPQQLMDLLEPYKI